MNFVKKTLFLAVSLLMIGQLLAASSGTPTSSTSTSSSSNSSDSKGTAQAGYLDSARSLATSGLNWLNTHRWTTGTGVVVAGSAALYRFNDAVKKRVNEGYETVKAKVSEGYTAVRSKVKPALDRTLTFGDAVIGTLVLGAGALTYKFTQSQYMPDVKARYADAKAYVAGSRVGGWFAENNTNRIRNMVIAGLSSAATITATVVGVKAYRARRAKNAADATSTNSSSSSSSSTSTDDEDEE